MEALSRLYGKLLDGLALVACLLLALMMGMICADVLLRNVALVPGLRGLAWSNEVSESMLYLITLLAAPWLLRQGRHIRVDILLVAMPKRLAWYVEWVVDTLTLAACLVMAWYGWAATVASRAAASMSIKTLVTPEWWSLAPLPAAFLLVAIEVLWRMRRLHAGQRGPRGDAVSAG